MAFDREHDASVLQGEGPYRDAVELLATADAQETLQALYREATATPAPEDDAIVRRIEATDDAIRRAAGEMDGIRARLRELAQRRAAIERERDVFRQQGYDRPYGRFDNGSTIGNVLGGILGGVIGGAVLRETLNGGFHREQSPWDSDFGGGLSPGHRRRLDGRRRHLGRRLRYRRVILRASRCPVRAHQRLVTLGTGGNSHGSRSISFRGFVSPVKNTTARSPSV